MAGRPKKFDEQVVLEAALGVFWKRGYEAASCDELLEAMGINSGSMYSTFGDKKALFQRAFELYAQQVFARSSAVLNGPGTPLENVRSLVRGWGEFQAECDYQGCLVSHTIIELGATDNPLGNRAKELIAEVRQLLLGKLEEARDSGELPSDLDPRELATFFVNTIHGLTVMARSGAQEADIQGVIRTMLAFLSEKQVVA